MPRILPKRPQLASESKPPKFTPSLPAPPAACSFPMKIDAPLVFRPLLMERVWGGRRIETLLGKTLPTDAPIGESWELVDREEAQSVVAHGQLEGTSLHELWSDHRKEIFGAAAPDIPRFPLLIKILDARERLSLQVHPPADVAGELGGEPKTEMWYLLNCGCRSSLYAGLRRGVTREQFEAALGAGEVEPLVHRLEVDAGDCMFIPSGRLHAIGEGSLIVEVQQNSDTTYRVFDWNRAGLDGKPRALHVEESMRSIDFHDVEPALVSPEGDTLVDCPLFRVERWVLKQPRACADDDRRFVLLACVAGAVHCGGEELAPGGFALIPASIAAKTTVASAQASTAEVLAITIP